LILIVLCMELENCNLQAFNRSSSVAYSGFTVEIFIIKLKCTKQSLLGNISGVRCFQPSKTISQRDAVNMLLTETQLLIASSYLKSVSCTRIYFCGRDTEFELKIRTVISLIFH
jgi:hypothetical protein